MQFVDLYCGAGGASVGFREPQFATTEEAVGAALHAADPTIKARETKKLASEREAALATRMQRLDETMRGLVGCSSFAAWRAELSRRGAPDPTADKTIRAYTALTKTGPSTKAACAAVAAFDREHA